MCAKCLKEGQMLDFTMPKKKKKAVVVPKPISGEITESTSTIAKTAENITHEELNLKV